jgi:hypothetical protein
MLRRSDFGLGRYVPMTGDELSVHVTLEAARESSVTSRQPWSLSQLGRRQTKTAAVR